MARNSMTQENVIVSRTRNDAVAVDVASEEVEVKSSKGSNSLAATKNVAQGMMDIALITANANQLRYILAYNKGSSTYMINLVLVSTSLILQLCVGVCLILKAKYKKRVHPIMSNNLSNFIVIGVFLITIINVFIASFTVTTENT
ncbi:hypothetical protein FQR65_LT01989 [Abscondita terminalis]|nr:hypothetical protein FQR65_LT01989 [Abscondita terminalis]